MPLIRVVDGLDVGDAAVAVDLQVGDVALRAADLRERLRGRP